MEQLILGWYILVETGSVLLLTLYASFGFVGTLIAPMFGVVGDRIGHRDLLAMMRVVYAVLATTLMTLALYRHVEPDLRPRHCGADGTGAPVRSWRARRAGGDHHAA